MAKNLSWNEYVYMYRYIPLYMCMYMYIIIYMYVRTKSYSKLLPIAVKIILKFLAEVDFFSK